MAMMWPANQFDVDDLVDGIGDFIDGAARQLGEAAESYSNFLASAEQQLNHWVAETDSFLDGMAIELAMTAMDGMMWTAYKTVKITSQQSINEMASDFRVAVDYAKREISEDVDGRAADAAVERIATVRSRAHFHEAPEAIHE